MLLIPRGSSDTGPIGATERADKRRDANNNHQPTVLRRHLLLTAKNGKTARDIQGDLRGNEKKTLLHPATLEISQNQCQPVLIGQICLRENHRSHRQSTMDLDEYTISLGSCDCTRLPSRHTLPRQSQKRPFDDLAQLDLFGSATTAPPRQRFRSTSLS